MKRIVKGHKEHDELSARFYTYYPVFGGDFVAKEEKVKIVAVSGYFTLLHVGHIRMFEAAKKLGDRLVVILNNDAQLLAKKGNVVVSAEDRKEMLEALECVDRVIISIDDDKTVCKTLARVEPHIFANGGDRVLDNVPEVQVCLDNGIELEWNVGGNKVDSSSRLIESLAK